MENLKSLEASPKGNEVPLTDFLDNVRFNESGLIAAIAQDNTSQQVLMLAWMDRRAIEETLRDGTVTYYSRSRQSYWKKGETSGHTQKLINMSFDCDGDAVLLCVEQTGKACHTFRENCFYLNVQGDKIVVTADPG
ncbi:MAG: phosphoribosyl-AMP cyclohydrolase [Candidatus Azotimanducaceae bacterium]|jgi:phosphoribosyl-AMP cyclohydrolase|tara:strand:- start:26300 stop:26707 length:408 start_codon:yes stop_codon:yes gene_type:complete